MRLEISLGSSAPLKNVGSIPRSVATLSPKNRRSRSRKKKAREVESKSYEERTDEGPSVAADREDALSSVLSILRRMLPNLKKDHGVRELAVFGSFVRGDQGPKSDVDILVDFDRAPGMIGFVGLAELLEEALRRRVDLVSKGGLRPDREATKRILAEAVRV